MKFKLCAGDKQVSRKDKFIIAKLGDIGVRKKDFRGWVVSF